MARILVTGALGQIGTELTQLLRKKHGTSAVVASDVRAAVEGPLSDGPFETLDVTDRASLERIVTEHKIDQIVHLAALLSATGEARPQLAWAVNVGGLLDVLEVAREHGCGVFTPSSIAAFGPSTPRVDTPQDTVQRPNTMYGISKVTGELLCDYYFERYGVDTRGVRFPGLISYAAPPGGGTTDYAVDIFEHALRNGTFSCFLKEDTRLDMMYMPDALQAVIQLMDADPTTLRHRNAFNISAMSFTPTELAAEIRKHLPHFTLVCEPEPTRQRIADSWPDSMDDRAARREWGWEPQYDLSAMVSDMLEKTAVKLGL
ncbi:MAG: L-threonine 3-dehydrogenase [Myxococcota bacterium]